MGVGVVIRREMQASLRRARSAYSWRLPAALTVAAFAYCVLLESSWRPADRGPLLLRFTGALMFLVAGIGGVGLTAHCISRERCEGTLGLVLLAGLSTVEIFIGKAVACLVRNVFALLATLPLLAICLTSGGVSIRDVAIIVVAGLNLLFVSMAVGMLASSVHERPRKATTMAVVLLLFFVLAPLLTRAMRMDPGVWGVLRKGVALVSPSVTCFYALTGVGDAPVDPRYFSSLLWVHCMGWVLWVVACWQMARSVRLPQSRSGIQTSGVQVQLWDLIRNDMTPAAGSGSPSMQTRRVHGWQLGILWGLYALACWHSPNQFLDEGWVLLLFIIGSLLLKLMVTSEAAQVPSPDRRARAMELLAVTPLSPTEFVRGQVRVLLGEFRGPVLAMGILCAGFHAACLGGHFSRELSGVLLLGALMLIADLYALAFLAACGSWLGGRRWTTILLHLALIQGVPWVLGFLTFTSVFRPRGCGKGVNAFAAWSWIGGHPLWLVFLIAGLVWDLVLIGWASNKLVRLSCDRVGEEGGQAEC